MNDIYFPFLGIPLPSDSASMSLPSLAVRKFPNIRAYPRKQPFSTLSFYQSFYPVCKFRTASFNAWLEKVRLHVFAIMIPPSGREKRTYPFSFTTFLKKNPDKSEPLRLFRRIQTPLRRFSNMTGLETPGNWKMSWSAP